MTPEQQRIAIAKACGWRRASFNNQWLVPREPREDSFFVGDPLNDLNAMHEAENALSNTKHKDFRMWLNKICHKSPNYTHPKRAFVSATASQRAEAFLRTLNLWTS